MKLDAIAKFSNHSTPIGEMGDRDRGILLQSVSPYAAENKEERIRKTFRTRWKVVTDT